MVIKTIQNMSKNTFGGINGFQKNKIGSVVGYKFRGEQVYRGYQKNVANPRTTAQVSTRQRFAAVSDMIRDFAGIFNVGFANVAKGTMRSPRNAAFKANYHEVLPVSGATVQLDKIVFAVGGANMVGLGRPSASLETISVPVTNFVFSSGAGDPAFISKLDIWLIGVSAHNNRYWAQRVHFATGNIGQAEQLNLSCPGMSNNESVYVYAFAVWSGEDATFSNGYEAKKGQVQGSVMIGEVE